MKYTLIKFDHSYIPVEGEEIFSSDEFFTVNTRAEVIAEGLRRTNEHKEFLVTWKDNKNRILFAIKKAG